MMKPALLAVVMVLGLTPWEALADDGAHIRLLDAASSVFADHTMSWRVELTDTNSYVGRVAWSLSVSGGVVARREQSVTLRPNEPVVVEIGGDLPAVNEGVVADGQLRVTLLDDHQQSRAEAAHPFYVFGRDPAARRAEWVKGLNLQVYDPDGATAQRLDDLEWPYRLISNLAAFETLGYAVLIVGEGYSLRDHRGLMESAVRAAQQGARVVFLAPTAGDFALAGLAEGPPKPTSIHYDDETFVRTLDKRLDVPPVRGTVRLGGQRTGPEWVVEPAGGWPCVAVRWPNGGTFLLVGFGLLDTWDASPAPRYWLVRMLEWETTEKEKEQ